MLKKIMHFLPCAFLAVLFIVTACSSPKSPPLDGPGTGITSVTISPNNSGGVIAVEKGGHRQFTAVVEVTGGAADTVIWTVTGKNSNDTAISTGGLLAVGEDETAETVTVTATSTVDNTKSASATVTVVNPGEGPQVTSVTIDAPKNVSVRKGQTHQFSATVEVTYNGDDTVTWDIDGGTGDDTTISDDGLLTVDIDETAATLTITATSALTSTMFDTATVTVINANAVQLDAVAKPQLSAQGVASWTGLDDESKVAGYTVALFKNENSAGEDTINKGASYSHDFISAMRDSGAGEYTVKVIAKGNSPDTADSEFSEASDPQTVVQRPTVTELNWSGDTATWSAGTDDTSGLGYLVKLYRNNNLTDKEYNVTGTSRSFASDTQDDGSYTFTVTALGNNYLVVGAAESAKSPANVKLSNVWLAGIPDWTFPTGTPMTQEGGTYVWEGNLTEAHTFRFSLTDTTGWGDIWNGSWFAPADYAEGGQAVTVDGSGNPITRFDTDTSQGATSATQNTWKIDTGYYQIVLNPGEMKMYVTQPVVVTGVTVNGPNNAERGTSTTSYTAQVNGHNTPGQGVTWSVTGGGSGTSIAANGTLTVALGETATELTIKATSTIDTEISGTKNITVSAPGATKLDTVSKPALSEAGAASWTYSSDANVVRYDVQLYKDSVAQGSPVQVAKGTFTHNFRPAIQAAGAGSYTVTVTAIGNGSTFTTSETSDKSDAVTFTSLTPVSVPSMWWDGNTAKWDTVTDASSYSVQLDKGASVIGSVGAPGNSYDFTSLLTANGNGSYTFKVKALGSGLNLDSTESAVVHSKVHLKLSISSGGGTAFGTNTVNAITYGNNVFVAVGSGGNIMKSTDGISWTNVDAHTSGGVFSEWVNKPELHSVCWGSNKFIAVGQWGTIVYSGDGTTWTQVTGAGKDPFDTWGTKPDLYAVTYGGSRFVLAGQAINTGTRTAWSTDGESWTFVENGSAGNGNAILGLAYGGEKFIAVGNGGRVTYTRDDITTVEDGTPSWGWIFDNIFGGTIQANAVAYGNGRWVIIGDNGHIKYTTDITAPLPKNWGWEDVTYSRFTSGILSVVYGDGKFVAVGHNGQIATSPDGAEWTATPVGTTDGQSRFTTDEQIRAAVFNNAGKLVIGGNAYTGTQSKFAYSE